MTPAEKIALYVAIITAILFLLISIRNTIKERDRKEAIELDNEEEEYEEVIKDKLTEEEKKFIKEYKDEMKQSKA